MSIASTSANTTPSLPVSEPVQSEGKAEMKDNRVSANLQGLLEEHKSQSRVVQRLQEELNQLNKVPQQYFQARKKFLYYAYTRNLDECEHKLSFEVKVGFQSDC
jgi:hypothetical protein